MSKCPYCSAQGGSAAQCGSCGHHKRSSSVNSGVAIKSRPSSEKGTPLSTPSSTKPTKTCFAAGTMILTPSGARRIDTLRTGDHVLTLMSDGRVQPAPVLQRDDHASAPICRISFADGSVLRTTANHSFRHADGWCRADQLELGDAIIALDSSGAPTPRIIADVEQSGDVEPVHNLIVSAGFTFFADGIAAHSFTRFRVARMCWWTLVAMCRRLASHGVRVCTASIIGDVPREGSVTFAG